MYALTPADPSDPFPLCHLRRIAASLPDWDGLWITEKTADFHPHDEDHENPGPVWYMVPTHRKGQRYGRWVHVTGDVRYKPEESEDAVRLTPCDDPESKWWAHCKSCPANGARLP